MPDDIFTTLPPLSPRRRSGCALRAGIVVVLAVVLAGAAAWLVWRGTVPVGHWGMPRPAPAIVASRPIAMAAPAPRAAPPPGPADDTALAAHVAALEARLDRLDRQTTAATANSARAEALLVAFATRRAIDRGAQLGYLEDELKLRFGDALPNSVNDVIAAAKMPLTLDQLATRLEAMAPQLAVPPPSESRWDRVRRDLRGLFVLRRDAGRDAGASPSLVELARVSLREGRIDDAIGDVQHLPGAGHATGPAPGWIAAARHYQAVQHALDLLETTALMEPRALKDGGGHSLGQPPA